MNNDYPDEDFPWSFYFNGRVMPKWGACWSMANVCKYLKLDPGREFDQDVGKRDIYVMSCRIDHVGKVESADSDIFIYVVQEVLHILLSNRATILSKLSEQPHGSPEEIYHGLLETAFQMRELALKGRYAFWTSGYESDREQLVETMRRCELPTDSPEFILPPHIVDLRREIQFSRQKQVQGLHELAQSSQFDKELRRRLNETS